MCQSKWDQDISDVCCGVIEFYFVESDSEWKHYVGKNIRNTVIHRMR